jgi:RNA polymerase sigma-70 factor (ECF subfamily)
MDVPAKTDAELLAEFAAGGSERAIEELIGRHGALVFNLCRRMLSNNADAEDAAQAVFVAMSAHIGSLQDCRCLSAWLHRTAFNACLQIRKAARVRQFREGEAAVMAPKESGEPENDNWEQLKPVLDSELNALPDKYRVPLVLFYFEGRSLDEGAALLRCKPHTLGAWLSRGRELLRSRLDRRGIALSAGVLATLLTEHAASAPLPRAFAAAAAKASTLAITGNSAAAAGISAHGAALLKGAILMGSEQTKAKLIALVIFLLLAGTAAGAYQLTERKAAATVPAATQSQLVEVQKTLDALRQDLSASQAQNAELKRQLQTRQRQRRRERRDMRPAKPTSTIGSWPSAGR